MRSVPIFLFSFFFFDFIRFSFAISCQRHVRYLLQRRGWGPVYSTKRHAVLLGLRVVAGQQQNSIREEM